MSSTNGLLTSRNVMAYFVKVISDPRVCKEGHIIPQDWCKDKSLEELTNGKDKTIVIGKPEIILRSYPNLPNAGELSLICWQGFYVDLGLYTNNSESEKLINPLVAIECGSDGTLNEKVIDLLTKLNFDINVKSSTLFMIRGNYGGKSDDGGLISVGCDNELKICVVTRAHGNGLPDNMLPDTKEGNRLIANDIKDIANLYVWLKNNYQTQQ